MSKHSECPLPNGPENCPGSGYQQRDKGFSEWVRLQCRHVMTISDIDFIAYREDLGRILLLEQKSHSAVSRDRQDQLFSLVNRIFIKGAWQVNMTYWGFYVLTFNKVNWEDSTDVTLRKGSKIKHVKQNDIRRLLELEDPII